ncbi:hypothetical protein LRS73_08650 [Methylobacterium currus]|uniref:hypothetical protein n=1 Tax=Methylobacterium currus TaxID=2051553 RepID=UPI001E5ACA6E|nr:hypothetical protein [Methylobacterium currus]UHC17903.1 hypothetical protein LRS73_08650 [Methylobacterium currus]
MKQLFNEMKSPFGKRDDIVQNSPGRTDLICDRRPVTILMTGTIAPPSGMPGTRRNDPRIRQREYLDAFSFYLNIDDKFVDRLIFLQNSNNSLKEFTDLAAASNTQKQINLIRCPSEYSAEMGKGYGEFMMIDYGIRVLRDSGIFDNSSIFWKITGRLRLINISEMISTSPEPYDLYCDLRYLPFIKDTLGGNSWMELRAFSFSLDFYSSVLENQYERGFVLEKEFFKIVLEQMKQERWKIVPRFRRQPVIQGVSGYSNVSYSSPKYRVKNAIRTAARRLAPSLWV